MVLYFEIEFVCLVIIYTEASDDVMGWEVLQLNLRCYELLNILSLCMHGFQNLQSVEDYRNLIPNIGQAFEQQMLMHHTHAH